MQVEVHRPKPTYTITLTEDEARLLVVRWGNRLESFFRDESSILMARIANAIIANEAV